MSMESQDLPAEFQQWLKPNTYHHKDFPVAELAPTVKEDNLEVIIMVRAREVVKYIDGVSRKILSHLLRRKW